jgi:hypothetical protein
LDEEKSKYASLAQHNGFGSTFLHTMLKLVNAKAKAEHLAEKS